MIVKSGGQYCEKDDGTYRCKLPEVTTNDFFPLTEVQMAYYMGRDKKFELGGVSCHYYIEVETKLDISRLNVSLQNLIKRHPMLRAIILPDGNQYILEKVPPYQIDVVDIQGINSQTQQERLAQERKRMSHFVFHGGKWPLFEIKALRLSEERCYLFAGFDLLIADAISLHIIAKELLVLYHNPNHHFPELELTFKDFVNRYHEVKNSPKYETDKQYWLNKLENFPSAPALPLKQDPSSVNKPHFNRCCHKIDIQDWDKLKYLCREKDIRPTVVFCTAYAIALGFWSNQGDLAINLTFSNRYPSHQDMNSIVGDFTSLMLIAVRDLNQKLSFWERAEVVQNTLKEALAHKDYDGIEFIRELSKSRNFGNKAIMPVVLTSLMFGDLQDDWAQFGTVKFNITQTAQLYLDNQVWKSSDGITLIWDYVEQLFEKETIQQIFQLYVTIIEDVINNGAEIKIGVSDAERQLIESYNSTQQKILPQTLHGMFTDQVKQSPDNIAILFGEARLTYRQLDELSNHVAFLLQEQGVGDGDYVGVLAYRCIESIINIMGILKSGAAYVPVDPEHPEERRRYILENASCKMILNPEFYEQNKGLVERGETVTFVSNPETVAYVIYTSGSSGNPKGVVITHQAAANTIIDINQKFRVNAQDRIIGISSMCFDLSVYDIFGSLSTGATLVMVEDQRDVMGLIQVLTEQNITVWNSVPALMDMVVENLEADYFNPSLRLVMLSGDWIGLKLPDKIRGVFKNAELISLGGATEASIWSIYYPIPALRPEWKSIPYGRPLANQQFYVLNYNLELCPIGVQGELYIGGAGIAKGYINDPEKTRNAFIEHPVLGLLYRTGDYGVMHREAYIEFLGRKDHQVKIRGHRIELGEIEAALREFPSVRDAVVLVAERDNVKQLVGYIVSAQLIADEKDQVVTDSSWAMLAEGGMRRARQVPEDFIPDRFVAFDNKLEELSTIYICNTLRRLGVFTRAAEIWDVDQVIQRCGVRPHYRKLLGQWMSVLVEEGWVKKEGQDSYQSRCPLPEQSVEPVWRELKQMVLEEGWKNQITYVEPFSNHSIPILKGELNPLTLLFADGNWELAEGVYQHNPMAVYFNEIAAETLRSAVNNWPQDKPIRILEFGAGTGGTTAALLAVLPSDRTFYTYTDISSFFTAQAKEKFKAYPFVEYKVFDIDKNPLEQGFNPHGYDVIFGANVLHDARILKNTLGHFKSILAPNGLLMILEITKNKRSHKISIGFIDGFSNYGDEREQANLPLHTASNWEKLLADNGFDKCISIPEPGFATQVFNQHIIVARGPSVTQWTSPEEVRRFIEKKLPEYMMPNYIIHLDTLPLTPNGKVDRKALPEPEERDESEEKYIAPRNCMEKNLVHIWENAIGVTKIGLDQNFFACGGDSLKAIRISAMAKQQGIKLSITDIYNYPTIAKLAEIVEQEAVQDRGTGDSEQSDLKVTDGKELPDFRQEQYATVDPEAALKPFPLTEVQLAYLVGRSPELELGGVATHYFMELETDLKIPKLSRCFQQVIQRHPMFRAVILPDGTQKILETVPEYWIKEDDLRNLEAEERIKYLQSERARMSHQIFPTEQWPLFEFKAFKVSDELSYLFISIDILIIDGSSMYIIGRELKELYDRPEQELPELNYTFRDYILAYQKFQQSDFYQEEKRYWLNKLPDFPPAPSLPMRKELSEVAKPHRFQRCSRVIGKGDWLRIKQKAAARNLTPAALICTAYVEVLAFWSNQKRLAIDLTVFNRYPFHPNVEQIVGDFTSLILVDIDLNQGDFWEHAGLVQQSLSEALEHRHYDGVEFIRELSKYRHLGNRAVVPVVFTCVLFDNTRDGWTELGTIRNGISQTPQVYLDNQVLDMNGELCISWDYVDELFDESMIKVMFEQYIGILDGLLESAQVAKLQPVSKEREQIAKYNQTAVKLPAMTLVALFKLQVLQTPGHIAVELNDAKITYEELDQRSDCVAQYLRHSGVVRGERVGVLAARQIGTIVNIMGILKAGAAYVPVNPEHPLERRNYILQDSDCKLMLEPELSSRFSVEQYATVKISDGAEPADTAYVIYTSGSTGKPKGVVISHGAVTNTILDISHKFGINGQDRIIGVSSMCFDLSVYDIFGALTSGATLVMVPDQRDLYRLWEVVNRYGITVWNSVPAIMDMMLESNEPVLADSALRIVLLSGDWIPLKLPARIKRQFKKAEVIGLGGATEASIWSIYYPITEIQPHWKSIPYGWPLDNQTCYVLNWELELCPVGVAGEIYIGGVGVANGYLNDAEKTQNAFIAHPVFGRIYRTGDYGVMHEAGYIEFLGRKDDQIKIRGHRIELGEIEGALLQNLAVKNAVVVDFADYRGNKALCAYLVTTQPLDHAGIREFLQQKLPDYMIPGYFVALEQLPLTANGKLDRKALPEPVVAVETETEYVAPRNEIEAKVAEAWQEILGIKHVSTTDDFFALGGDSIKAIQISAYLQKHGLKLALSDQFTYHSIGALSEHVEIIKIKADQGVITGNVEFTPIQRWLLDCGYDFKHHWNQAFILSKATEFDTNAIQVVVAKIVEHHDALRMCYRISGNQAVQFNRGIEGQLFGMKVVDLTQVADFYGQMEVEISRLQQRMDLENGPLLNVGLFKTSQGDRIFIAIHHLVVDGVSWRIILEDFALGYDLYLKGEPIRFQDKTTSFKEWSQRLSEYANSSELLAELEYWSEITRLGRANGQAKIGKQAHKVQDSKQISVKISEELTHLLLKKANQAYHTEINDILLTALGLTLNQWKGLEQVAIHLEGHGREEFIKEIDVTRTVGWFTSMYPLVLRTNLNEGLAFNLKAVKEMIRRIPNKGVGYGILKYLTSQQHKDKLQFDFQPEIGFNYLGQFEKTIEPDAFEILPLLVGSSISPEITRTQSLDVVATILDGCLTMDLIFAKDRYSETEIRELADQYRQKLTELIEYCANQDEAEFTPSDFAYEDVTIEELDEIQNLINQ